MPAAKKKTPISGTVSSAKAKGKKMGPAAPGSAKNAGVKDYALPKGEKKAKDKKPPKAKSTIKYEKYLAELWGKG